MFIESCQVVWRPLLVLAAIFLLGASTHGAIYGGPSYPGDNYAGDSYAGASYLGLRMAELDPDRSRTLKLAEDHGVEVKEVEDGGPAGSAGIKPSDVLLSYNGENILGTQQFVRLVQETPVGRKVRIQFWRDGKMKAAFVTIGSRPSQPDLPPSMNPAFPDGIRSLLLTDIPRPLLVWKNPMLGIEFERLDAQLAQYFGVSKGLLIRSVDKGSVADRAGVRTGDVIVSAGHKDVWSPRDLTSCLRQPGVQVPVSLVRDRKRFEITISLPVNQQVNQQ